MCVCVCVRVKNGTRATTWGNKRGCLGACVCVRYNSDRADKCYFLKLKFMLMALPSTAHPPHYRHSSPPPYASR